MKMFKAIKSVVCIFTMMFAIQAFAEPDTTDAAILKTITQRMSTDSELSGLNIAVDVKNGVVSLGGTMDTESEGSKAVQIAQSTPGVTDVDTGNLKVKNSTQAIADTLITAKIKGVYLRDKIFTDENIAAMAIKVDTVHGVVTLTGTVDSKTQADNAVSLARSVKGVMEVKSDITVKNPS